MEFQAGAKVVTADGDDAGELDRVVMDPRSKEVTHLIVRKGLLFRTDKVLPVELVTQAEAKRIKLRPDADLEALPNYEEKHYVMADERDWVADPDRPNRPPSKMERPIPPMPSQAPAVYWYPSVLGYPGYMPVPGLVDTVPGSQTEGHVQEKRNLPPESVALKEGVRVVAADGEHVGNVMRVFSDPDSHKVTHILLSQGLLGQARKVVPMAWVLDVGEDEVRLAIGSSLLQGLREYAG